MKSKAAVMIIIMAFALSAFAHGGAEHVMGTVVKTSSDTIEVKTTTGETKQVMFDDKTSFTKAGAKAQASDLEAGDRVVIDVHDMDGMLHASEVKIGTAKAKDTAKKDNSSEKTEHSH